MDAGLGGQGTTYLIYRIFKNGTHEKLDEVQDVNWPLNEKDAKLGVIIDLTESLSVRSMKLVIRV